MKDCAYEVKLKGWLLRERAKRPHNGAEAPAWIEGNSEQLLRGGSTRLRVQGSLPRSVRTTRWFQVHKR